MAGVQRALVAIAQGEATTFAAKQLLEVRTSGGPKANGLEFLNADLVYRDGVGRPFPVLAEALPELGDSSWRVFPDGSMETTYRLRPNLTWHDGQPLTASDFVFASQIYANPEFGVSQSGGFQFVEEVAAPDAQTVVISWKQTYPDAIWEGIVAPLPRHILGEAHRQLDAQQFMALPFWKEDYIGAGPWKVERVERGVFFEGSAFDGFVFGRPKIDRIRVIYIADTNVALTAMLAGEAHYSLGDMFYTEEGLTLQRQWAQTGAGVVVWGGDQGRAIGIQHRPQYATPSELASDVRVRRALAHLIDKEAMLQVIAPEVGTIRDVYTHPREDYYDAVARAVSVRYSYDPRRAEQLLAEARFVRRPDGSWETPRGERFTLQHWHTEGTTNAREGAILAAGLREFGIEASAQHWPTIGTTSEDRATISGIFAGSVQYSSYYGREIGGPQNRWVGGNRGGYLNPELDRLLDVYLVTLDRSDRTRLTTQIESLLANDLPGIPLYWTPSATAHAGSLKGVAGRHIQGTGWERRNWEWYWEA